MSRGHQCLICPMGNIGISSKNLILGTFLIIDDILKINMKGELINLSYEFFWSGFKQIFKKGLNQTAQKLIL
jgi:hypothetical protein